MHGHPPDSRGGRGSSSAVLSRLGPRGAPGRTGSRPGGSTALGLPAPAPTPLPTPPRRNQAAPMQTRPTQPPARPPTASRGGPRPSQMALPRGPGQPCRGRGDWGHWAPPKSPRAQGSPVPPPSPGRGRGCTVPGSGPAGMGQVSPSCFSETRMTQRTPHSRLAPTPGPASPRPQTPPAPPGLSPASPCPQQGGQHPPPQKKIRQASCPASVPGRRGGERQAHTEDMVGGAGNAPPAPQHALQPGAAAADS